MLHSSSNNKLNFPLLISIIISFLLCFNEQVKADVFTVKKKIDSIISDIKSGNNKEAYQKLQLLDFGSIDSIDTKMDIMFKTSSLYEEIGKLEESNSMLIDAYMLKPGSKESLFILGKLADHAIKQDDDELFDFLTKLASSDSVAKIAIEEAKARKLLLAGQFDSALNILRALLDTHQDNEYINKRLDFYWSYANRKQQFQYAKEFLNLMQEYQEGLSDYPTFVVNKAGGTLECKRIYRSNPTA